MGLLDRPRVPAEARLGRPVLQGEGRAARVRLPLRGALARPRGEGVRPRAAAGGQGPGLVGDLPRQGARRPGLRAAQARPAQRGDRPLPLGAADVRRRRARHRQHGDAGRLRHRGAEEALARADVEPGDVLRLLDDRAAGRQRPEPVQDPRRARRRRVGDQRREVVHVGGPRGGPAVRDVRQRHVRRAAQDARRGDDAGAAQPQSRHLPQRAGAARSPARSRRTAPGRSRSGASAAGASTTRCARSRSASSRST